MSRPVRAGDPSRRTKFPGASCGERLKAHSAVSVKVALYCIIGDDVHPYRINDCDDPVSSRARQLSRDIAEVLRSSDRNVVNMASSMVTAPLIKSGPCSGKRGASTSLVWTKSTLWRSHRATNR